LRKRKIKKIYPTIIKIQSHSGDSRSKQRVGPSYLLRSTVWYISCEDLSRKRDKQSSLRLRTQNFSTVQLTLLEAEACFKSLQN
jgi:hypothetical protein